MKRSSKSHLSTVLLLALFASIGFALPCAAQTKGYQTLEQLMESPAGSNIVQLIEHLNSESSTSDDQLARFFSAGMIERVGVSKLQAVLDDIRTNDGKWEIYDANRTEIFRYELKAKGTRHGKWLNIFFLIEPQAPYKIDGIEGVEFSRTGPQNETPLILPEEG